MHYWSPKERQAFAERIGMEPTPQGKAYVVENVGGARTVVAARRPNETRVLLLEPAPWRD
jgi:hypothetical protein